MKKVTVNIAVELELPDDCDVIQHKDGIDALKYKDKFCTFSTFCMTTASNQAGVKWIGDQQVDSEIIEYVTSEQAAIRLVE
ncbi:hypothetical protein [Desulfogranum marinum]|uniref:hypothetical protein n=1 Tax=Desulfogranum marinum TaxID=453220 RepID=UPI001964B5B2|nr:hypothetical protein [Desulfogranum marinum]MBM9512165.1 hypothetical protein [Desulfogranum marinum]